MSERQERQQEKGRFTRRREIMEALAYQERRYVAYNARMEPAETAEHVVFGDSVGVD